MKKKCFKSCFCPTKGFTLIELLVVVLIIGILAAVALSQYKLAVAKSRLATIRPLLASIRAAEEAYYLVSGEYTNDWSALDVGLSACEKGRGGSDIMKCGDFWIDPLGLSIQSNIIAGYCPEATRWEDCRIVSSDKREYEYVVWFTHSTKPNQIECTGTTNLGKKVCATLN